MDKREFTAIITAFNEEINYLKENDQESNFISKLKELTNEKKAND